MLRFIRNQEFVSGQRSKEEAADSTQKMEYENTELTIYLIRHGQAEINTNPHLLAGQSRDAKLTPLGVAQAQALGRRLRREVSAFSGVYSATIWRAFSTAAEALKAGGFTNEIIPVPALDEFSQGDWEGRLRSEVYTPETVAYMNGLLDHFGPPNGESMRTVRRRVTNWFDQEVMHNPRYLDGPHTIGIFGHRVTDNDLLQDMMGFDTAMIRKILTENTSVSHLFFDRQGWWVKSIGDTGHLWELQNPTPVSTERYAA